MGRIQGFGFKRCNYRLQQIDLTSHHISKYINIHTYIMIKRYVSLPLLLQGHRKSIIVFDLKIVAIVLQGVLILCAQKLTTYKIIIGEHCGVILFVKF